MSGWQNVSATQCPGGKMSRLQNIRVSKCLSVKMSKCQNVEVSKVGHLLNVWCRNVWEPLFTLLSWLATASKCPEGDQRTDLTPSWTVQEWGKPARKIALSLMSTIVVTQVATYLVLVGWVVKLYSSVQAQNHHPEGKVCRLVQVVGCCGVGVWRCCDVGVCKCWGVQVLGCASFGVCMCCVVMVLWGFVLGSCRYRVGTVPVIETAVPEHNTVPVRSPDGPSTVLSLQ